VTSCIAPTIVPHRYQLGYRLTAQRRSACNIARIGSRSEVRRSHTSCTSPGKHTWRYAMGSKSSIDQLNSYLRGEMAAVETYQMAIDKLDAASPARDDLLVNLKSHQDRVTMLQDALAVLGGTPAKSSGPWGKFAKAVEGTAKALGDKMTVSALE